MSYRRRNRQMVVPFDGRGDVTSSRIRGGKGSSLAVMAGLHLPVPPGFTITTTLAKAMRHDHRFPNRLETQLVREMRVLEKKTGKKFGDPKNPLLVSVRSGAEVSMPGMMDTILNLGMNQEVRDGLAVLTNNKTFAHDCYTRFLIMFGRYVLDAPDEQDFESYTDYMDYLQIYIPEDPWEQLRLAIRAVLNSWNNLRAKEYRALHGIDDALGTAINIQAMVFGNLGPSSATGVVFSHDVTTGKRELFGEFLPCAQGEDIVSGSRTPRPIAELNDWNSGVFCGLKRFVAELADEYQEPVEVEFTVEENFLHLLQCRVAKLTALAAATVAVHGVWEQRFDKKEAVKRLSKVQIAELKNPTTFTAAGVNDAVEHGRLITQGLPASPGVAVCDMLAFTSDEAVKAAKLGKKVILVRPDTNPDDLPGMLVAKAIVTFAGGATSHAAVVAREIGIPAVVGAPQDDFRTFEVQGIYSVDGNRGLFMHGAVEIAPSDRTKEVNIFLRWRSRFNPDCPAPKIGVGFEKKRHCVNTVLADVYITEAMAALAQGTNLEDDYVNLRNKTVWEAAELFSNYLSIAVASELRYANDPIDSEKYVECRGELTKLREVYRLSSSGEKGRGDPYILSILASMTIDQHIEFFRLARIVFDLGVWSSRIGGKKWGRIAEVVEQFLSGKLTHAIFVDRVFDLRHNGGCLFDKNGMVSELTNEEYIVAQLNAKRDCRSIESLMRDFAMFSQRHNAIRRSRMLSEPVFCLSVHVEDAYLVGAEKLKKWKEPNHG